VYRAIATLANPGAFRTWLFSTTRRRAFDHLRKRRREQELIADAADDAMYESVDESALDAFDAGTLDDVLAGLPPPQREVLLLRFQDQMSYSEIAVIVGCPVGTVKTRIHHAKRKLHDILTRGSP
jgi:RNA polymerase sigma-70 factor (ECF subfamily)